MVKNLPEMQETWVQSLGWEDHLAEGMATHSSILAWRVPLDRGAWRASVRGSQRAGHDQATKHSTAAVLRFTQCTPSTQRCAHLSAWASSLLLCFQSQKHLESRISRFNWVNVEKYPTLQLYLHRSLGLRPFLHIQPDPSSIPVFHWPHTAYLLASGI